MFTLLIVVYDPVLKHLQRKQWKKERTLSYFVFANFASNQFSLLRCLSSLSRSIFHYREHIVSKIFPWIPISVTSWLYEGLMLASIHVKVLGCLFINRLYSGNETRSPVGNGYLLGASVHLPLNAPPPSHPSALSWSFLLCNPVTGALHLLQLGSLFHFQCSTWCRRHMAAVHRNGPEVPICLHGLHQSQTLPCISLATTRSTDGPLWSFIKRRSTPYSTWAYNGDGYGGKLWCDLWGALPFHCDLPLRHIINPV